MTEKLEDLQARAAHPAALHGCSSKPCGSVVCQTARDRDALLIHAQQLQQQLDTQRAAASPAPLGADQKMKISAVRKAHKIQTRRDIFTREEWLLCSCSWTSQKVKPEGTDWETEKLEHTIDALNRT